MGLVPGALSRLLPLGRTSFSIPEREAEAHPESLSLVSLAPAKATQEGWGHDADRRPSRVGSIWANPLRKPTSVGVLTQRPFIISSLVPRHPSNSPTWGSWLGQGAHQAPLLQPPREEMKRQRG